MNKICFIIKLTLASESSDGLFPLILFSAIKSFRSNDFLSDTLTFIGIALV